jgi:hypothetical protein
VRERTFGEDGSGGLLRSRMRSGPGFAQTFDNDPDYHLDVVNEQHGKTVQ